MNHTALVSYLTPSSWAIGVVEEVVVEILDLPLELVIVFFLSLEVLMILIVCGVKADVQLLGEEFVYLVHEELLAEGKSLISSWFLQRNRKNWTFGLF